MSPYLLFCINLMVVAAGLFAIRRITRLELSTTYRAIAIFAVSGIVALFVLWLSDPDYIFSDFRIAYYPAGKAVLTDRGTLGSMFESGVTGFVNLPILAYLFAPFALFSPAIGAALFTLVGLAITVLTWLLLVRVAEVGERERWILLFLFAASGPLHYSVKEGNSTHMVLLGLVGGLYLLRGGRPFAAGLLLGAMTLIKLPLMLFGVYLLLRRNWQAFAGYALIGSLAALLSLVVFGWDTNWRWFELCVLKFGTNPLGAFNVQSFQGFIVRLLAGPEVLRDWSQTYPLGTTGRLAASLLNAALYALAIGSCIWAATRSRPAEQSRAGSSDSADMDLEYLMVLTLCTVSSPLSWTHYYTWLLMPIAFFLGARSPFPRDPWAPRVAWLGIFLMTPAVFFLLSSSPAVMEAYARFGVSHVFFGGLIWFALLVWSRLHTSRQTAAF